MLSNLAFKSLLKPLPVISKPRLRLPMMSLQPDHAQIHKFYGRKYGVKSNVLLDFSTREAEVELQGVVLGGKIAGRGRLSNPQAESGTVILEKKMEEKLSRRGIAIVSASLDRNAMQVTVVANVVVIGRITIVMNHVGVRDA